ncbi:MAG: S4 domain-containing protein [Desulfobulbaceae bacterium]|nr:S4 domain-containing protein [Desulfobulbaceae bacterium]
MEDKVRIDKWLWAARFFKTRSLASEAVNGGHVHINGERVKPSKIVKVGDQLTIRKSQLQFVVLVLSLSGKRGPAVKARTLYEETAESVATREKAQLERKILGATIRGPRGKPDKRERRKIREFIRKD